MNPHFPTATKTAVIIVAAGRGTRVGGDLPKQWQMLAGKSVLSYTVAAFRNAGLQRIVLVIHPDDQDRATAISGVTLVNGGKTRNASVSNALEALANDPPEIVLIHDGARPLVPSHVIHKVIAALQTSPGAAPALAVTDALWRGKAGRVSDTQNLSELWRAQTPQGFRFVDILSAHRANRSPAADDVTVARAAGMQITIVEGDEDNIKLTYPADFARAEALLKGCSMTLRIGNGYDVHAFTAGDHVWLCGIRIPHDKALLGHSDADVGMHALTDAIYGALAMGDIGRHFPPDEPQWKGAASHIFLSHAIALAAEHGWKLSNCDVTLVCERPKINLHVVAMQAQLAQIMGVDSSQVSVKATTSERLGFTGREEGIAALATALMVRA